MNSVTEKPGAQTPWIVINSLVAADECFAVCLSEWKGYLIAPKQSSKLAALLYALHQQKIAYVVQGRGTNHQPESHHQLILSTRAFSQVILHEQDGTVEIGAGCALFNLQGILFEQGFEVALVGQPLATSKRSIAGLLLSQEIGGLQLKQDRFHETLLGLEFVTHEGSQIKWGSVYRSGSGGLSLHQLIWGCQDFPGVIIKFFMKAYPMPIKRLYLNWSFRCPKELWESFYRIKNFTTTWEKLDCVQSGIPTEQGYILAQISGLREELDAFQEVCPYYSHAKLKDEESRLKHYFLKQGLKAYSTTLHHSLAEGDYLWYHGLDERSWLLTKQLKIKEKETMPLWKQRLWTSLSCTS